MRILIATPAYRQVLNLNYVHSIIEFNQYLAKDRTDITVHSHFFPDTAAIFRSRNAAASLVLENPDITHLVFIDSDTGFSPSAVSRLLDSGHDFAGCLYPRRRVEIERFHAASARHEQPQAAWKASLRYVAAEDLIREDVDGKSRIRVEQGFARTAALGTGLTVIARSVFERLRDRYPELILRRREPSYTGLGVKGEVFQCFSPLQDEDGMVLSEDMSFCRRWREGCGGEMWACVDEWVSHVGLWNFSGRAIESLR